MDGKTATMIGAAALATSPVLAGAAQAAPAVPPAASYADLLQPIPNAVARLQLADQEAAARPPMLIEAQYVAHHHHHHHHHARAWYLSHGYGWIGGRWVLRPVRHHHHHHHHHNY